MIINPKNAPFLSSHEQCYLLYIQQQMTYLRTIETTFDNFVDAIYNLGQCKQEMFDDEVLSPSAWCWLNVYVDNVIYSLKKGGGVLCE